MIIGATIFFGIYLLGASICFITTQGLEAIKVLTDGGREMSQYPMNIYKNGFLTFFTFVILCILVFKYGIKKYTSAGS